MMINSKKILGFLTLSVLSLFLVVGCDRLADLKLENPSQATPSTQLIVSAAASLKTVMEEIKPIYEQNYPGTEIIYNFASSGSLQRQIEQGAPVDVFISAAKNKMDDLEKQDLLLTETRQDLLTNQIVLITPTNNNKNQPKLKDFKDLTTQQIDKIALGEPSSVPAGKYAQEVLNSLGIADPVNDRAIYAKDVRQIVNYVATGNVDAGIVYRTDAQVADNVEIVAIAPETSHSPVIYPIAAMKDSTRPKPAIELIEFLTNPETRAVFKEYGFLTISNK